MKKAPVDDTTPDQHLPWSHLTKAEFREMKDEYAEYWAHHLNLTRARVLQELAFRTNYETGACFPGVRNLADELHLSRRTIQNTLKELEDADLITVARQEDRPIEGIFQAYSPSGRSNNYTVGFQFRYEPGRATAVIDSDLVGLTLGGRAKLPISHVWYNAVGINPSVRLKPEGKAA